MKTISAIIILTFGILARPCISQSIPEAGDLIARVAPDIIKQAHRYHGIDTSIMDSDGRLYFYRGGKKCKLFTEGFLKNFATSS